MLKNLLPVALSLLVLWKFEFGVEDVLEYSPNPDEASSWTEVPGPYLLDETKVDYQISVPTEGQANFFRVRRYWGVPRVSPEELPPFDPDRVAKPEI